MSVLAYCFVGFGVQTGFGGSGMVVCHIIILLAQNLGQITILAK